MERSHHGNLSQYLYGGIYYFFKTLSSTFESSFSQLALKTYWHLFLIVELFWWDKAFPYHPRGHIYFLLTT